MSLLDKIAVQLWSVRDVTNIDYAGTLKKLSEMGYTGVEFAGYGSLCSGEIKEILTTNGLKPVGAHIGLDRLTNALDEELALHKVLGTEYLVCPHSDIKTKEDALKLAESLNPVIAKISAAGFKFAYHNHAHEFVKSGGEYLLDILFSALSPEAVMELDLYWVSYADVDLFAYMEKHKDRLKLIHVKQIGKDKRNVDIDQGLINYKEVIIKAKALGVEHFIIEQEEYAVSSMVSIKNDIDYILNL